MGNCLQGSSRRGRGGGGEQYCAKKRAVWAEEKVTAEKEEEEEEKTWTTKTETPPRPTEQVKIRITRKQLDELLQRVDDGKQDGGSGVPARDVISELLSDATSSSSVQHGGEHGQWRPSLQSIPE